MNFDAMKICNNFIRGKFVRYPTLKNLQISTKKKMNFDVIQMKTLGAEKK